jgi:hypothetical protein
VFVCVCVSYRLVLPFWFWFFKKKKNIVPRDLMLNWPVLALRLRRAALRYCRFGGRPEPLPQTIQCQHTHNSKIPETNLFFCALVLLTFFCFWFLFLHYFSLVLGTDPARFAIQITGDEPPSGAPPASLTATFTLPATCVAFALLSISFVCILARHWWCPKKKIGQSANQSIFFFF